MSSCQPPSFPQAQEDKVTERFVLAVDPHKASWTAAVVDHAHRVHSQLRVPASRDGWRRLRRLARGWPAASLTWAGEGAHGLGLPLVERLIADGISVVDVPAKLSARVRLLATGNGRKTDAADAVATAVATAVSTAVSTAVAALTAERLRTATVDEHTASLRLQATTATTWSACAPRPSTACTCCWSGWCRRARPGS
jgi:transposase